MSNEQRRSIHIDLTPEQRQHIKDVSGQDVPALELNAEELEQRIAPAEFVILKSSDTASAKLF